jgi:hypothetical protein
MLGDEVWIENAPGGPVGTIVFGTRDDHVGLSAPVGAAKSCRCARSIRSC